MLFYTFKTILTSKNNLKNTVMSFGDAIKSVFSKYATFSGRARRSEYWYFVLFTFLVGIVVSFIPFLNAIWPLVILLPSLAVSVRRLHDIGKSGWNILWLLLPNLLYIGYIVYFLFAIIVPTFGWDLADIDAGTITKMLLEYKASLFIMAALELFNFIMLIVWIVWMCKDSEPNENKWGPNPKIAQPEF